MSGMDLVFGVDASLTGRRWEARGWDTALAEQIEAEHGLSPLLARLLASRNIVAGECDNFLTPSLRACLPDPSQLAGMDKAAARTAQAVVAGEKIAVFGDYDADGVCSASLLKRYFATLGVEAAVFLPSRMDDGYGLNKSAMDKFAAQGINLLLIADCGTSDGDVLAHAAAQGIEPVILDHHPAEAPPPDGILVNPNCPPGSAPLFAPLAASGLVFVFLVALNRALRQRGKFSSTMPEPDLMAFLDLAALGTICDVAPLTGINRIIVLRGLERIAHGNHPGLAALANGRAVRDVSADYAAFVLGPKINAAGRVGHPELAMRLLCAASEEEARQLAAELDLLNRQRQAIEKDITQQAIAQIEANEGEKPESAAILAFGEDWHMGVLGITAARLRDRFHRNAFVVSFGNSDEGTGSARGMAGSDVGRAVRAAAEEGLLVKGGGHPAAAGFTLKKSRLDAFKSFLQKTLLAENGAPETPALALDATLPLTALNRALYDDFQRAAPFGKGNPEPKVALESLRLLFADPLKGGHLRLRFAAPEGGQLTAMMFRQANSTLGRAMAAGKGERFHVAGSLRPAWNGYGVEIILEDAAIPA